MPGKKDDELKLPVYMSGRKRAAGGAPVHGTQKTGRRRPAAAEPERQAGGLRREVQPKRPRHRGKRRINLKRLITVTAVLAAAVYAVSLLGRESESMDVIGAGQRVPAGAKVLGIDVGGMTKTDARNAIREKADGIIAQAGVKVLCGGREFAIKGRDINLSCDVEEALGRALSYEPSKEGNVVDVTAADSGGDITNVFSWNGTMLRMAIEDIAAAFNVEPVDAKAGAVQNPDHTISISCEPGTEGRVLNVEETQKDIETMFSSGSFSFALEGRVESIPPSLTEKELQGTFGLRASYSTEFPTSTHNEIVKSRVFNIEKAADMINGCIVAPGEEWSFNGFVGLRTYDGGWKGAKAVVYGKGYAIQAGGGICQVSTTLYNALLCADVEITERRAHTIPSDYAPKGLDATVDSTGIDLKFKNGTGAPLFLFIHTDDVPDSRRRTITVEIYGRMLDPGVTYKTRSKTVDTIKHREVKYTDDNTIPRGYKLVTLAARNGYKAEVYRDRYLNGEFKDTELLYTEVYRGNDEEARRGTASPKYYKPPKGAVKMG